MAKHTAIMETSTALVNLLRKGLSPDIILNPETIGLCGPDDKSDFTLGIHLYDIRESEEIRINDMKNVNAKMQRYPSTYLSLSYMITAYSAADVKFRAGEEHRILGKVVQVLADNGVISPFAGKPLGRSEDLDLRIRMMGLTTEEKQRIWQFPNIAYKASLFYKISPIEIESQRVKDIQRVVEMEFSVEEVEDSEDE